MSDHKYLCMVMRINVDCNACCRKIRRIILNIKGIETHMIEKENLRVTVCGIFKPSDVAIKLRKKMKRRVEILDIIQETEDNPTGPEHQNQSPPRHKPQSPIQGPLHQPNTFPSFPYPNPNQNPNLFFPSLENENENRKLMFHPYSSSSIPDISATYNLNENFMDMAEMQGLWRYDMEFSRNRDCAFYA